MPELSNSIRQRLGSRPAPAKPPDADILTAYAEQLLPAGERKQITQHLAACSFCREVVYLSLPTVPELTAVHTLPGPSRFWKFGFRWAGAVAVLAIAAVWFIPTLPHKQLVQGTAVTPQGSTAPVTQSSVSKTLDATPAADQSRDLPTVPSNTRSESLSANNRTRGAEVISRGNGNVQSPPPVPIRVASETAGPETAKDVVISSVPTPSVASILAASNQAKPVAPQGKEFVNNNFYIAEERTGRIFLL